MSEHFKPSEFACHCGCGFADPSPVLVRALEELRERICSPIHILSGCRCESWNRHEHGKDDSEHLTGKAADIRTALHSSELLQAVLHIPEFRHGGIGVNQVENFLHVDVRGWKARWGYGETDDYPEWAADLEAGLDLNGDSHKEQTA